MPRQETLFDILGLRDQVSPSPAPHQRQPRVTPKPSTLDLATLSDAEVQNLLSSLTRELQRRLAEGRGHRPELEAGIRDVLQSLESLMPAPPKPARRRSGQRAPILQEGQRKAVRAALLAGVSPGQVARHFGLPLAAVRKVIESAT